MEPDRKALTIADVKIGDNITTEGQEFGSCHVIGIDPEYIVVENKTRIRKFRSSTFDALCFKQVWNDR